MRTRKMRLLSFVLALAMMLAIAPLSAFADDSDPMGTLIKKQESEGFIIIDQPGTYQMHGEYDVPVLVTAAGEVIINITGKVDYTGELKKYTGTLNQVSLTNYPVNYAINAINPDGNLIINNEGNYKFSAIGENNARGVLRVFAPLEGGAGHAVVNYGYYTSGNVEKSKETFFNYYGTLKLNHVNAEGLIVVKNYGGVTEIDGGTFKRGDKDDTKEGGAIVNKAGGQLTVKNAEISAEKKAGILDTGGTTKIEGGSISSADEESSAIRLSKSSSFETFPDVEINGTTIKDSKRGISAKEDSGKATLKDVTFQNNDADVYLAADQELVDFVDTTNYNGKPFNLKIADANGNTTLDVVKPATLIVEGGKVTVDAASIGDEAIEPTVNDKTTTVKLPVGAVVTVAFDENAYADSNLEFGYWDIKGLADAETYKGKKEFTFEVPNSDVTIKAMPSTESTDDSWDAATVVTGVAIGAGAAVLTYHIGTELYAEQVLGKGVAVPKTREDVALKAWELAGKPAVAVEGEPLSEAAQAEKWAVESGLMQNVDGSFNGAKKMNKLKALRVLDSAKKMNAQ